MYLVFDIGGTKMRLTRSFDGENLYDIEIYSTPQEFEKAIEIIQKFVWKSGSDNTGKHFCFGLPGVFDLDKKTLVSAPNLPFWVGKNVRHRLEEAVKGKVELFNDAELSGLGESLKGSGKGREIVAYVAVGTGIGGVRVVNGKIDVSKYGFEPGHQIIDFDGSIDGRIVDLEGLIGGVGLKRRYSIDPESMQDENLWEEVTKILSVGLINTIVHWSPEIVVLGGSVCQNEHISPEKISYYIRENLKIFPNVPTIVKASLGEKAALFGGIELLKSLGRG